MRAPTKRSRINIPQKPRASASVALAHVVSPQEVLTRSGGAPAALEAAFLALLQSKTAISAAPATLPIDRRIFLTLAESAEFSGLPAAFLRRLMTSGQLKAVRTGAGWRIARAELEGLSGTLTAAPQPDPRRDLTEHELRDLELNRRRRREIAD